MVEATLTYKDGIIHADCMEEGTIPFQMTVDQKTFEILSCSQFKDMYALHAAKEIKRQHERTGIWPEHIKAIWF